MSTAALGALAVNWPVTWAVAYASALAGVTYDLSTMCATDPPADPGFTAADGLAMLNPFSIDPRPFADASAKLQQLLKRYAWYQFCECTSVATPAPPAAPAAPSGLPDPRPAIPCFTWDSGVLGPYPPGFTIGALPAGFNTATGQPLQTLPPGASNLHVVSKNIANGATHNPQRFRVCQWTSGHVPTCVIIDVNTGATVTTDIPVMANAVALSVEFAGGPLGGSTDKVQQTIDISCNFAPGGGCCPPDPSLIGMLQQLMGSVTLIQRQLAPFAYLTSTVHAGLSGAGSFDIQGLLGVKVDVTVLPGSLGQSGTTPVEYFDMGYITFGTDDGYPHSVRLERAVQLILPARCSVFTTLAYDLNPLVEITITELVREP